MDAEDAKIVINIPASPTTTLSGLSSRTNGTFLPIDLTVRSFSCVQLFCSPMDCSPPAPLSTGFSRQEYWHGFPFLPNPRIESVSPALAGRLFTPESLLPITIRFRERPSSAAAARPSQPAVPSGDQRHTAYSPGHTAGEMQGQTSGTPVPPLCWLSCALPASSRGKD